jgi:uncharacterized membrane protein
MGYLFLAARVIGMGLERPLVKRLSQDRDAVAATVLYVGLGELMFLVVLALQASGRPDICAGALSWLPLALVPSLLNAACFFSFIHAMRIGEVSLLTPLFAVSFIVIYALDVAAGYAPLSLLPLSGVLLVTLGVVLLAPASEKSPLRPATRQRLDPRWLLRQPGALLMLINALAFALARYFDKTLAPQAEPVLYALTVNAPTVLVGLALLALGGRRSGAGLAGLTALFRERWATALTLTLFGQGAFLMLLYALDYFPPSVVEPVTQLGVFIAIALGGLWFGERIRARWLPGALVVCGAVLLLI